MKAYQTFIANASQVMGLKKWNVYFSPGRINLIGEHTDYNGGYVLPCAIDRGIMGAIALRGDKEVRCYSHTYKAHKILTFDIDHFEKDGLWTDYVKGIIKEYKRKFPCGFDLYIESDLPKEAGLSSSACIEMLIAKMISREYEFGVSPFKMASIAQRAENKYIGVKCGIMDPFAIAMGKENKAVFLDTASLEYEHVDAKFTDTVLVIANTNKSRALVNTKYNERYSECQRSLKAFKKRLDIDYLCDMDVFEFEQNKDVLDDEVLLKRTKHVVYEDNRTRIAKKMLEMHDLKAFGQLMFDSHKSLKEDYEVSCEELDLLVDLFADQGAIGARMTGAGFGGSVVALMPVVQLEGRLEAIKTEYIKKTKTTPEFYTVKVVGGTHKICLDIQKYINELMEYAKVNHIIDIDDYQYAVNRILDILGLDEFVEEVVSIRAVENILEDIAQYAYYMKIIDADDEDSFDRLKARVIDCVIPRPHTINERFQAQLAQSAQKASQYLYQLGLKTNYIQTRRIQKNIDWRFSGKYETFKMTINLSKPEKDPNEIARLLAEEPKDYPKCQLCIENVGFSGTRSKESRRNLRIVRMMLDGEEWFFQYSPYAYFPEHSIVLSKQHKPMIINQSTFRKMVDFVKKLPHYFVGSNADLPIVGGSILTHEHFQSGNYVMPIETAKSSHVLTLDHVDVMQLYWPLSTIRLQAENEENLITIATKILKKWQRYENKDLNIINSPDLHNTITPICRFREGKWIMDIILRNNVTTEALPWGVFHPHEGLHHIKKENIGLIEAMGVAILPGRLERELDKIQKILDGETQFLRNYDLKKHQPWIEKMIAQYDANHHESFIYEEVGKIFEEVLECAGVFKQNTKGNEAFLGFIKSIVEE